MSHNIGGELGRHVSERDRLAGLLLKKYRQDYKMSQTDFAARIGVSFQQLYKYESGHNRLSIGRLMDCCDVLHISAQEFMCRLEDFPLTRQDCPD